MLSVCYTMATNLHIGFCPFVNNTAFPEGHWLCITKTGRYDEHTWDQFNCSGEMEFNKNGIITSSCAETFAPSCSKWKTEGEELLLADFDDQIFVGL